MILHIFRHEGKLEKKKKYTKHPKSYKNGIFNRTIIEISAGMENDDKEKELT